MKRLLGVLLLGIMIFGFLYIFEAKTFEINLPAINNLCEIVLKKEDKNININDEATMENIITNLKKVEKTKMSSVSDRPVNAKEIIEIEFKYRDGGSSIVYIYQRDDKYYLEQAYNGIYNLKQCEYLIIANYLN